MELRKNKRCVSPILWQNNKLTDVGCKNKKKMCVFFFFFILLPFEKSHITEEL